MKREKLKHYIIMHIFDPVGLYHEIAISNISVTIKSPAILNHFCPLINSGSSVHQHHKIGKF